MKKYTGDEELHNLYSSKNIIRMIKLQMRWVGQKTGMQEMHTKLWRTWTGYIWLKIRYQWQAHDVLMNLCIL
jgi:hypothetical protein